MEDLPISNPTVPGSRGPLKSVSTSWIPILGVNTSLVVARMSSPAEPAVALRGLSDVGEKATSPDTCPRSDSRLPHIFAGPGGGPVVRFLNGSLQASETRAGHLYLLQICIRLPSVFPFYILDRGLAESDVGHHALERYLSSLDTVVLNVPLCHT